MEKALASLFNRTLSLGLALAIVAVTASVEPAFAQTQAREKSKPARAVKESRSTVRSQTVRGQAQPVPLTAQPAQSRSAASTTSPPVLDFEADVIEGEGKKPDVLLDFDPASVTLDSLLYKRSDFNDHLSSIKKNRLRHQLK